MIFSFICANVQKELDHKIKFQKLKTLFNLGLCISRKHGIILFEYGL